MAATKYPLKMWIVDALRTSPEFYNDNFVFRGISARKVDVSGVVTKYQCFNSKVLFTVDDGTGSISCKGYCDEIYKRLERKLTACEQKIKKNEQAASDMELTEHHMSQSAAQHILAYVLRTYKEVHAFELGDCVLVRGFLTDFHGQTCINAFEVFVLSPTLEVARIHEVSQLYRCVYNNDGGKADENNSLPDLVKKNLTAEVKNS